jgi:hypothetical protein
MKNSKALFGLIYLILISVIIFIGCKKDEEDPPVNAGATVAPTTLNVSEEGLTANYTIVLTDHPTADVTVTLAPDAQVSANVGSVLFTNANWNVPQTVTVSAIDDSNIEGDHMGTISHTSSSSDNNFNGMTISSVIVNIEDNDQTLIVAGSRVGKYVAIEPGTGNEISENTPGANFVLKPRIGYLGHKVFFLSTITGEQGNVIFGCDAVTGANQYQVTNSGYGNVSQLDGCLVNEMLAFSAYLATNNNHVISTVSENGTGLSQITEYDEVLNHPFQNVDVYLRGCSHPAWSPDGTKIGFSLGVREVVTNFAHNCIGIMNSDGSNKQIIYSKPVEEAHYDNVCFTADGQFLLFSLEDGGKKVKAIHLASNTVSDITSPLEVGSADIENITTSPNEMKLAYHLHLVGGGEIYVSTLQASGNSLIASSGLILTDGQSHGHGHGYPDWAIWDGK